MPKPKNDINDRQRKFVLEYLKCFNATRAAIKAGYSKKTAFAIGHENLSKPKIRELIEKEFDKLGYAVQIALMETLKIATSDIKDFLTIEKGGAVTLKTFDEIPEGMTSCIKEIEENRTIHESADGEQSIKTDKVKYKLYDKQKATSDILRVAGKFKDNIDLRSKVTLKVDLGFEWE